MNKRKIINDPIYGLISYPFESLYELIDHPYFQRLRRISQMGLSSYVYPGATHTRFSHALGALHLMTQAINTLREKGVKINDEEYLAVCQAILLHDIGHGPFSHGLENILINKSHERISYDMMVVLDKETGSDLRLAMQIYRQEYKRPFLAQLVSSQLDMDRMDYLTRDSFYTGVVEGVIGYKRLISMMDVVDDQLVMEEKALISIEKFLMARHFMYKQVYLHKTAIVAERMMKEFVLRLKELVLNGGISDSNQTLSNFFIDQMTGTINDTNYLDTFIELDDIDVLASLKAFKNHPDLILNYLSTSILSRRLFQIITQKTPISSDLLAEIRQNSSKVFSTDVINIDRLIFGGQESIQAIDLDNDDIKILKKNNEVISVLDCLDPIVKVRKNTRFYACFPKLFE